MKVLMRSLFAGLAPLLLSLVPATARAESSHEWQQAITDGDAALSRDDADQAAASFVQALAIVDAPDHDTAQLAISLDKLAEVRFVQNRDAEAEGLYRRSLAIREAGSVGPDLVVADSLGRLADVLFFQDRHDEAENLYHRALFIGEEIGGPADTARYLDSLGLFYNFLGRETDALPLLERSLSLKTAAFGPDGVELAPTLDAIAETQFYLQRLAESEALYRRSLTLREAALGAPHPESIGSIWRLAGVIRMRGREAEAERLFERAFALGQP